MRLHEQMIALAKLRKRKPPTRSYPTIVLRPNAIIKARVDVRTCEHGNLIGPLFTETLGPFTLHNCDIYAGNGGQRRAMWVQHVKRSTLNLARAAMIGIAVGELQPQRLRGYVAIVVLAIAFALTDAIAKADK